MKSVLFICTGNYYRSRMAEELFNFWARAAELPWEAHSAGLRQDMDKSPNEGPISRHAVRMLTQNGFPVTSPDRYPRSVSEQELEANELVICMHKTEHEPMVQKRFPENGKEILFWKVPDVEVMEPEEAFARIKSQVHRLISILSSL